MQVLEGLGAIAKNYDAMLIDQFGVIHDGQKLYFGVAQVLAELRGLSTPVCVMTNSGKRTAANRDRLVSMGLAREDFVDAMSSGEVAYQRLGQKRCYFLGKTGEDYGFDGAIQVDDVRDAELLVILGSDAPRTSLAEYGRFFEGLTIPALCCNPDRQMLTPTGLQPAPGAIAQLYADQGGDVTWIGKPYPEIYQAALDLMGRPTRVLCIGDSAEHDVAGGQAAGLETLLVMTGVSAGLDAATLDPQPNFVLPGLVW
jgi:HAD superfamily hydrolase (TIGR01459 family)